MALQTYYYAQGHDQVGSLAVVSIQPHSWLIQYPEVLYALGAEYDNGTPFVVWNYSALEYADMATLFSEFGLSMSTFSPVRRVACTIWTAVDEDYESNPLEGFLNAYLIRPDLARKANGAYFQNVDFVFRIVEATS